MSYGDYQAYTQTCNLPPGNYELICSNSYGDGWHGGYIEIQGNLYCDDASSFSTETHTITVTGTHMYFPDGLINYG